MFKRIVWFVVFVLGGIVAWAWLRRLYDDRANVDSQFALLDSAPQTAPAQGHTAASTPPPLPPPPPDTPLVRSPEAEPTVQEINPASDAPGETPSVLIDSPMPADAVLETPPAPPADASADEPAAQLAEAEGSHDEDGSHNEDGITAYCMHCKAKRVMVDPAEETTENGRHAARGTCPVCGTTMFTFLPERSSEPPAE